MERNCTDRRIVLLVGDYQNNHLEGTMGEMLRFHTHARASAPSSARTGGIAAKASKVICEQPNSLASRTNPVHRLGGMPRVRQVLTVLGGKPSAADTAPVPPRASIAEPAVSDMAGTIVRNLRTSQVFADCEATFSQELVPIGAMADALTIQAKRLTAIRRACGKEKQSEFYAAIKVGKSAWSDFENGKRPLTLAVARKIKARFRIPLDFTLDGDLQALELAPRHIADKLQELVA